MFHNHLKQSIVYKVTQPDMKHYYGVQAKENVLPLLDSNNSIRTQINDIKFTCMTTTWLAANATVVYLSGVVRSRTPILVLTPQHQSSSSGFPSVISSVIFYLFLLFPFLDLLFFVSMVTI